MKLIDYCFKKSKTFFFHIIAITTSIVNILVPLVITKVLKTYSSIFLEPTELPPQRFIDHRIPLLS